MFFMCEMQDTPQQYIPALIKQGLAKKGSPGRADLKPTS